MKNQKRFEITDQRVESAVNYIAETGDEHAKAKSYYHGLCELRKTVLSKCWSECTGGVKEREMLALTMPEYVEHLEKIESAEIDFNILQNKRKLAELTIELWRTASANQRRGNI